MERIVSIISRLCEVCNCIQWFFCHNPSTDLSVRFKSSSLSLGLDLSDSTHTSFVSKGAVTQRIITWRLSRAPKSKSWITHFDLKPCSKVPSNSLPSTPWTSTSCNQKKEKTKLNNNSSKVLLSGQNSSIQSSSEDILFTDPQKLAFVTDPHSGARSSDRKIFCSIMQH